MARPELKEATAQRRKSEGSNELVQKQIEKNVALFQQEQMKREADPPAPSHPPLQPVQYAVERAATSCTPEVNTPAPPQLTSLLYVGLKCR
eukprot:761262-Hanusia_phi.AAC.5